MVATGPVILAITLVVLATGAVVGLLAGWIFARLLAHPHGHLAVDALCGAVAFLAVQFLAGAVDLRSTYYNGSVIGLRGVILNHVLMWRVGVTLTLVAAHHVLWRSRHTDAEAGV